jgi:hypothetical protein
MRPRLRRMFWRPATEAVSARTGAGGGVTAFGGTSGGGGQGPGSGCAGTVGTEPGGLEAGPGSGCVGRISGARGVWQKLKSLARFPRPGASSRTSGRESGRPSVFGFRRRPSRKSSSMNFRQASWLSCRRSMYPGRVGAGPPCPATERGGRTPNGSGPSSRPVPMPDVAVRADVCRSPRPTGERAARRTARHQLRCV